MAPIIRLWKSIKGILKKIIKRHKAAYISPVRRIDEVALAERVVAMTFDDGPSALPTVPDNYCGRALTTVILDHLKKFGARVTFDVIGDTSENYPDTKGKEGTAQWGGVRFDHYPDFKKDKQGGAVNQPELMKRIISEGHEVSNHGYRHLIFGKEKYVYGARESFPNLAAVVSDLGRLHSHMLSEFGYRMQLARPAHYVDKMENGLSSYDVYYLCGYQYLGASEDGAGWLPKGSYDEEVEDMFLPFEKMLLKNPRKLCGKIIFQKDGYSMSKHTPVADGLEKQLELLDQHGYRVVPVSELLAMSPTADIYPDEEILDSIKTALANGFAVLFDDNTFRRTKPVTRGELVAMLAPPEAWEQRIKRLIKGAQGKVCEDIPVSHKYSGAISWALSSGAARTIGGKFEPDRKVSPAEASLAVSARFGTQYKFDGNISRTKIVEAIASFCGGER